MSMFGMTDHLKTRLVHEIYQRPLIWKPSDPRYTDVPARWVAFEEVAQVLSSEGTIFSSDMVKMAWKNMTDYYNHIRRRSDRAKAAGLSPPVAKWHFFNMLHFIRQEKAPVKRKYNWLEPSKIASDDSWVHDNHLTEQQFPRFTPQSNSYDSGSDLQQNNEYNSNDTCNDLPRPIPIRPPLSAPEGGRPRTKQSEKFEQQFPRFTPQSNSYDSGSDLQQNNEYNSNDTCNDLPRPIPIRPPLSAPEGGRPRTKQSEKAKLQAKRQALRDANLGAHSDPGIKSYDGSPLEFLKNETPEVGRALRRRVRDDKGRFTRKDRMASNSSESVLCPKGVSKRGRKLVKKRLSLSPSPPRTPLKNTSPKKSARTTSVSPLKQQRQRSSNSPQKQSYRKSPSQNKCDRSICHPVAFKPISALDSTSYLHVQFIFASLTGLQFYFISITGCDNLDVFSEVEIFIAWSVSCIHYKSMFPGALEQCDSPILIQY
ncbi:hypothetical protein Tcan_05118 [Toxocara canis]|uniref:MADF domain-containing protein n=1 Tax=Toxocara canis TaxID=6265 RepID=A0A0B2VPT9_TOXCA|nr:hypothetical protein Tcan_05118 [Toxocara canis]